MLIRKRDKVARQDFILTVDEFLADINKVFGDKTKHQQLTALRVLVEGKFYQNLEVAYYIVEAISKSARKRMDETRVDNLPHLYGVIV